MILCLGFSKGLGIDNMTRSYSITFETKCYENDWEFILKGSYLKQIVGRCNVDFDFKQLIISHELGHVMQYYSEGKTEEKFAQTFATFMMEFNKSKVNR